MNVMSSCCGVVPTNRSTSSRTAFVSSVTAHRADQPFLAEHLPLGVHRVGHPVGEYREQIPGLQHHLLLFVRAVREQPENRAVRLEPLNLERSRAALTE
jgi:hypothetical protein